MIKFLDLNTGCSFDGLWETTQTKGYIFWFPNEQSTNITYTMPICIVSDKDLDEDTVISVDNNEIYSIVSHVGKTDLIDGFLFDVPKYSNEIKLSEIYKEQIGDNVLYLFNIACNSELEGEFICKVNIGDYGYIRVGADFYGENESLYINMSNMGVDIPESIQKAIYDANVHEDLKDNILINRKFKELLSNYWDIVANKGSYKSLLNSLKWFEWGDLLVIKEIWKHSVADKTFFTDKEILSLFENNLNSSFENYIKTTYVSLYYSMYDEIPEYDDEYNPILIETAIKWSRNDLQLKLSLLAQFLGIYFLPIHLSILHATAEDKVFTNTIKTIIGTSVKRDDAFGDFTYIESNIKDNSTYKMTNVKAQVTTDTIYGNNYNENENVSFGVDAFTTNNVVTNENIYTFAQQYYTGPGVIIPIEMIIKNQKNKDFIKYTIVDIITNKETKRLYLHDIIAAKNKKITIKFKFLAKYASNYILKFTFVTGTSKTLTKNLKFIVEDADNLNINIYKVQAKDDSKGFTYKDFADTTNSQYFFKIQKNIPNTYYIQHLPYMSPDNQLYDSYKGIKLSRTVVFDIQNKNNKAHAYNEYEQTVIRGLMDNDFLEFDKRDANGKITYMIFVSKYFYASLPQDIINKKFNIIRNDLGFYPQFHNLVLMHGNNIADYTVSQYEAVCCAAEINTLYGVKPFRYGHMIDSAEWTFTNATNNDILYHPTSSRVPFIANEKTSISPGYYDVSFKYSLTNGIADECKLDSGFRIKVI